MDSNSEVNKYLEEGLNFYGLGKFKQAIECWKKVLEIDPDNSLAKDYIESAGGTVDREAAKPPSRLEVPPARTTKPPPPAPPPPPEPDREAKVASPPPEPEREAKVVSPPPKPDREDRFRREMPFSKEVPEEPPPHIRDVPPLPEPDLEDKLGLAKSLFAENQFEQAMEIFESILQDEPDNLDVQGYYEMARSQQLKKYKSEVGDLAQIPRVGKSQSEILKLDLNHEEGFILSLVDGSLEYNDLFSLSNMDDFKTYRIICRLLRQGIIGV